MSSHSIRPSTLVGIKRRAKSIKAERGIIHALALDASAQAAGYSNYAHAQRSLAPGGSGSVPMVGAAAARAPRSPLDDFHERCRKAWTRAVEAFVGVNGPSSTVWRSPQSIVKVLEPFMGINNNHAHFPGGGGMDILRAGPSNERGCLELEVDRRVAKVCKPRSLTLERIEAAPGESFLMLELDELASSGIEPLARDEEEVLELSPGDYRPRRFWDLDIGGYDSSGREIPLPDDARLVIRFLRGKILFVSKGSLWNGSSHTYDGEHNALTPAQVREVIEHWLTRRR